MSTLDDWISEVCAALDLPEHTIPADLRTELLDVTRDVAHGVARVAGPLTCYLLGVAVGQGRTPSAAVTEVKSVLPAASATEGEGA